MNHVEQNLINEIVALLIKENHHTRPMTSLIKRKINTAFVYTMNLPEARMNEFHYPVHTGLNESILNLTFGHAESLFCNETLQFEDYDKVVFRYFDPEERRKRRREIFPKDCPAGL
jgi:hypothetical protein